MLEAAVLLSTLQTSTDRMEIDLMHLNKKDDALLNELCIIRTRLSMMKKHLARNPLGLTYTTRRIQATQNRLHKISSIYIDTRLALRAAIRECEANGVSMDETIAMKSSTMI